MEATTDQIRKAVIQLAADTGRDHYCIAVVKEVIFAIKNDTEHHLKSAVIQKIKDIQFLTQTESPTARLKLLASVCRSDVEKKTLCAKVDIPYKVLCSILKGHTQISVKEWDRLQPYLKKIAEERNLWERSKEKEVVWG